MRNIDYTRAKFWKAFVAPMQQDIQRYFRHGPRLFRSCPANPVDELMRSLIVRLDGIIMPGLIRYLELNGSRAKNGDHDNQRYAGIFHNADVERVLQMLAEDDFSTVRNLYHYIDTFRGHLFLGLERTFSDWSDISKAFKIKPTDTLEKIHSGFADAYNPGEDGLEISMFDSLHGFSYKPRSTTINSIMQDISGFLMNDCKNDNSRCKLKVVSRHDTLGNYGYVELPHVHKGQISAQYASKLYYNIGKTLAIAKAFNVRGVDADNIAFSAPHAFILDYSASFQPLRNGQSSIENTGMLAVATKNNYIYGIRSAVQSSNIEQISHVKPVAKYDATDHMSMSYGDTVSPPLRNAIKFAGDKNPSSFANEIKQGYKAMTASIVKNNRILVEYVQQKMISDKITVSYEAHSVDYYKKYMRMMNDAHKGGGEFSDAWRSEVNDCTTSDSVYMPFIRNMEFMDLSNYKMPKFFRTSKDRSLHHVSGSFRENFFSSKLQDDAVMMLESVNTNSMQDDLDFIDEALSSTEHIKNIRDFAGNFNFKPSFSAVVNS